MGPGITWHYIDSNRVYIAASDELFAYTPDFKPIDSWRCPFLKHCHEIAVHERTLFLTSTGFDSILGFDLDRHCINWAMNVQSKDIRFKAVGFDPQGDAGPMMMNKMHINNDVPVTAMACTYPGWELAACCISTVAPSPWLQNCPPVRTTLNHFATACCSTIHRAMCCAMPTAAKARRIGRWPFPHTTETLTHRYADHGKLARPGFARGLCVLSDSIVAGGSSPSTVAVYDLAATQQDVGIGAAQPGRLQCHPRTRDLALRLVVRLFARVASNVGSLVDDAPELFFPQAQVSLVAAPLSQGTGVDRLSDLFRTGRLNRTLRLVILNATLFQKAGHNA